MLQPPHFTSRNFSLVSKLFSNIPTSPVVPSRTDYSFSLCSSHRRVWRNIVSSFSLLLFKLRTQIPDTVSYCGLNELTQRTAFPAGGFYILCSQGMSVASARIKPPLTRIPHRMKREGVLPTRHLWQCWSCLTAVCILLVKPHAGFVFPLFLVYLNRQNTFEKVTLTE